MKFLGGWWGGVVTFMGELLLLLALPPGNQSGSPREDWRKLPRLGGGDWGRETSGTEKSLPLIFHTEQKANSAGERGRLQNQVLGEHIHSGEMG